MAVIGRKSCYFVAKGSRQVFKAEEEEEEEEEVKGVGSYWRPIGDWETSGDSFLLRRHSSVL